MISREGFSISSQAPHLCHPLCILVCRGANAQTLDEDDFLLDSSERRSRTQEPSSRLSIDSRGSGSRGSGSRIGRSQSAPRGRGRYLSFRLYATRLILFEDHPCFSITLHLLLPSSRNWTWADMLTGDVQLLQSAASTALMNVSEHKAAHHAFSIFWFLLDIVKRRIVQPSHPLQCL